MKKKQQIAEQNTNSGSFWRFQKGFTLVELLVVISIIGILAGLLITNLVGVRGRAADARIKNDLVQLKKALRLYYNDYQQYPLSGATNTLDGCGTDGDAPCTPGGIFSAGTTETIYMKALPIDFSYINDSVDNESFLLSAELDNVSDADIEASAARCSQAFLAGDATYYVCSD